MNAPKFLGPYDEPQQSAAVVAVHWGDYRRQELWMSSGIMGGTWRPLGGDYGVQPPRIAEDPRNEMEKLGPDRWRQPPGTIPPYPDWGDVLARGPVVLLTAADGDAYLAGWKAGRRDLWQAMEEVAEEEPK